MKQIGLLKAIYLTHKADKMNNNDRAALQKKRLRKLISYVKENSPYFSEFYKEIHENTSLSQLPTTNKIMMMNHFDEWMTDKCITKEKIDIFMSDLNNVGRKFERKYLVYSTSGSTGNPCIVLYDDTAINVVSAIGVLRSFARREDMKRFIRHGGRTIALFADNGFYLGCSSVRYNLNKKPWKKNKMKTYDVRNSKQDIIDTLNKFQPSMIGTYPTVMELLADERDLHIKPAIIMTGGEYLSEDVRNKLSQVFNCYVQTNYSCTEGGTVACECINHHFHINDDWIIIEPVDENNQPVSYGIQSSKILLTNLTNRICPIIRFEITDRIVMHNEPCSCGNPKPWLTLEGRTDDILTFENGVKIAPLSLYVILKEIHIIKRFQVIQVESNSLELRLTSDDKHQAFVEAKQALENYLKKNKVEAHIFLSEKLPEASPISGKFKHIISKSENKNQVIA